VLGDSQRHQALSLAGAVVLLVEDDDDARELTSRILQEVGARVIEARNAETALTRVIDGDANVLISDIGMANQDGYQLLREIRRRGYGSKRLPAIALTAFARMEDRESALAAGFQEHLVKNASRHVERKKIRALHHMVEAPCRVAGTISIKESHARLANIRFLHVIQDSKLFKERITEGQQRFPYVIPRELCLFQNQD